MRVPPRKDLETAAAVFARDWGGDEVLYGMCASSPGHSDHPAPTAKVALVDRIYAAGRERQIRPDPGKPNERGDRRSAARVRRRARCTRSAAGSVPAKRLEVEVALALLDGCQAGTQVLLDAILRQLGQLASDDLSTLVFHLA